MQIIFFFSTGVIGCTVNSTYRGYVQQQRLPFFMKFESSTQKSHKNLFWNQNNNFIFAETPLNSDSVATLYLKGIKSQSF